MFRTSSFLKACALFVWVAESAMAGSHSWRISEVYSNSNGTIQFIELVECCGLPQEVFVAGEHVTSNSHFFQFPGNLTVNTSNKKMLLATDGFAALPGAPPRDFAIVDNFFSITGDTIRYNPEGNYDTFTFSAGDLPTNGVDSIQITDHNSHTFIVAPNNPTNLNGDTDSIFGNIPTVDEWGLAVIALSLLVAGTIVMRHRRQACA